MNKYWTQLLGDYKGNEIINNDMISRPISEWSCIDSNTKYYKVLYRAENSKKAKEILDAWKNETLST